MPQKQDIPFPIVGKMHHINQLQEYLVAEQHFIVVGRNKSGTMI